MKNRKQTSELSIDEKIRLCAQLANIFKDLKKYRHDDKTGGQEIKNSKSKGIAIHHLELNNQFKCDLSNEDLKALDAAYNDAGDNSINEGDTNPTKVTINNNQEFVISPRINLKGFSEDFNIPIETAERLSYRERILFTDIIFDLSIEAQMKNLEKGTKADQNLQSVVNKFLGSILRDCLNDTKTGLAKAGEFEASEQFIKNLLGNTYDLAMNSNMSKKAKQFCAESMEGTDEVKHKLGVIGEIMGRQKKGFASTFRQFDKRRSNSAVGINRRKGSDNSLSKQNRSQSDTRFNKK